MKDANKLNQKIYTHHYNHQMKLKNMVSKIVIKSTSNFNREDLKTILSDCSNAEIIQK
jgi:hypothetical protein